MRHLPRKSAIEGHSYALCRYRGEIALIGRFQGKLTQRPLRAPLSWPARAFGRFRDVSTRGPCECDW